jgi:hypothetical protein
MYGCSHIVYPLWNLLLSMMARPQKHMHLSLQFSLHSYVDKRGVHLHIPKCKWMT